MVRLAVAVGALAVTLAVALVGETWSAFTGTTANPGNTLAAATIFSGSRSTSAWSVRDAADASEGNVSDPLTYAGDGLTSTSITPLPTTYSSTKYATVRFESSAPSGLALTGATLRLNLGRASGTGTLSFFFEVRKTSDGTVLATHGSSGAPVGTATGTTLGSFTRSLPELATTTLLNDVTVRIYAWDTGGQPMRTDRVALEGTNSAGTWTQHESWFEDRFTATSYAAPRTLHAAGDFTYLTTTNWSNAFSSSRYLRLFFEPDVPAGATITGVTFTHVFRPQSGGGTQCVYYEARLGTTVLSTHFSSASPSCQATGGTYKTDALSLTAVDTVAEANGLELRVFGRNDKTGRPSEHDRATVAVTYKLD